MRKIELAIQIKQLRLSLQSLLLLFLIDFFFTYTIPVAAEH